MKFNRFLTSFDKLFMGFEEAEEVAPAGWLTPEYDLETFRQDVQKLRESRIRRHRENVLAMSKRKGRR